MTIAARVHPLYGLLVSDNGGRSWTDTDGVDRFMIGDTADPVECHECARLEHELFDAQEEVHSYDAGYDAVADALKDARGRIADLEGQLEERAS